MLFLARHRRARSDPHGALTQTPPCEAQPEAEVQAQLQVRGGVATALTGTPPRNGNTRSGPYKNRALFVFCQENIYPKKIRKTFLE